MLTVLLPQLAGLSLRVSVRPEILRIVISVAHHRSCVGVICTPFFILRQSTRCGLIASVHEQRRRRLRDRPIQLPQSLPAAVVGIALRAIESLLTEIRPCLKGCVASIAVCIVDRLGVPVFGLLHKSDLFGVGGACAGDGIRASPIANDGVRSVVQWSDLGLVVGNIGEQSRLASVSRGVIPQGLSLGWRLKKLTRPSASARGGSFDCNSPSAGDEGSRPWHEPWQISGTIWMTYAGLAMKSVS
jgi:hypothetical protein